MEEYFGALPVSNSMSLCVGGITETEAAQAREAGIESDGTGYFLFLASQIDPTKPVEVVAKFDSPSAAERLARLLHAD